MGLAHDPGLRVAASVLPSRATIVRTGRRRVAWSPTRGSAPTPSPRRRDVVARHFRESTCLARAPDRLETAQNRKRNHPRPRLMDTSRVDGVRAPQSRLAPIAGHCLKPEGVYHTSGFVHARNRHLPRGGSRMARPPWAFALTEWTGRTCSQAFCPRGDNPFTFGQNENTIFR